eukprot:TRINITY_DN23922_c1_g1_i5.p5 TRINITY_DN23922_c1_g1~~TRINITY_DN23922_c1_g1_i5.p5  ORF type:complete len:160 (+),score=18.30 TRINITY_DN23922_c1_g1_i5:496-975(+)
MFCYLHTCKLPNSVVPLRREELLRPIPRVATIRSQGLVVKLNIMPDQTQAAPSNSSAQTAVLNAIRRDRAATGHNTAVWSGHGRWQRDRRRWRARMSAALPDSGDTSPASDIMHRAPAMSTYDLDAGPDFFALLQSDDYFSSPVALKDMVAYLNEEWML